MCACAATRIKPKGAVQLSTLQRLLQDGLAHLKRTLSITALPLIRDGSVISDRIRGKINLGRAHVFPFMRSS